MDKSWLDHNLVGIRWKGSQARGRLICRCGCKTFFLFNRKKTPEEALEEFSASQRLRDDYWPFGPVFGRDKEGRSVVRKSFLWFMWKERPLADYEPNILSFLFVSAKCEKCGREIVLFDERSCWAEGEGPSLKFGALGEIKWRGKPSFVELVADLGEEKQDLGRLRVYRVYNGKKALFFDHEIG